MTQIATRNRKREPDGLDPKLLDVFCAMFGEQYRHGLTPQTDMDAIPEWTSASFLDLVFAIEQAYGVSFSDDEAAQMFQLGLIDRIVRDAILDRPHDDIAHACTQLHAVRQAPASQYKMVVLSSSSTREGFVPPAEGRALLASLCGRGDVGWYNISVADIAAAEMLQLVEVLQSFENGVLAVGLSPVLYAGCGEQAFRRAARHLRFPFAAPNMDGILRGNGYSPAPEEIRPAITLDEWVKRYLKGRDLEHLVYDPYRYPTRAPWARERFGDAESIRRYYDKRVLNTEQSMRINSVVIPRLIELCHARGQPLVFLELTLHSRMLDYLERGGGMVTRTRVFIEELRSRYGIGYVTAATNAGIADADFRDPGHIYRKRKDYTLAAMTGFLSACPPAR